MSVIKDLKKYILVDGFHVVIDPEKSHGSYIVEHGTGKRYLDCYSQFASQALGWNHDVLVSRSKEIASVSLTKMANSDMYSETYRDFIETFAGICPDFEHFFFIEGGALGVENALKAAFDWKCQVDPVSAYYDGQNLDVIHLQEAFHGRTGYTLSLTNTGDIKTKWFPKFKWTRVVNPKAHSKHVKELEKNALSQMKEVLSQKQVAAIIFETIQGEGGDNQFRPSFFKAVRKLADDYQAMLILDEVQSGMGLTGKWWAYEHYGIKPDMITFGKKVQVGGFACNSRIDEAPNNVFKQSGRINSTWGGNLVDMARAKIIIETIQMDNLLKNAKKVGDYLMQKLDALSAEKPEISNVRGKGLMVAFDLPSTERRDQVMKKLQENMLSLKSGNQSIRFRPCLTFSQDDADHAVDYLWEALD